MLGFRFDRMRNHENQKYANHKMPVYSVYLKNKVYMTALREKIRSRVCRSDSISDLPPPISIWNIGLARRKFARWRPIKLL